MSKARDASFRATVILALATVDDPGDGELVAKRILELLREQGYALHDTAWCVRIRPQDRVELGRPMTEDERMTLRISG